MSTKKKHKKKHPIQAKYVEDLPVSILVDIAEVLGCRVRFELLPAELVEKPASEEP